MLVLSRRPGQKICFPELGISIEVLRSSGGVIKLGIRAPQDVQVNREEVQERRSAFSHDFSGTQSSGSSYRGCGDLKDWIIELKQKLKSLQGEFEDETSIQPDHQLANIC